MDSRTKRKIKGRVQTIVSKMQELKEIELSEPNINVTPSSFEGALQDLIHVYMDM